MTKAEKLKAKLANARKTFVFSELITVLNQLGYDMQERAGSRVVFIHKDDESDRIHLHKPHPENTIKGGALKAVKSYLSERGYFDSDKNQDALTEDSPVEQATQEAGYRGGIHNDDV